MKTYSQKIAVRNFNTKTLIHRNQIFRARAIDFYEVSTQTNGTQKCNDIDYYTPGPLSINSHILMCI